MSDQRLRDLERRWKSSGSIDDEAAYLIERVRVGNLSNKMIQILLLCDHPATCNAFPVDHEMASSTTDSWLQALYAHSTDSMVRAAIACGRSMLPLPRTNLAHVIVTACIDHVIEPTIEKKNLILTLARDLNSLYNNAEGEDAWHMHQDGAFDALIVMAETISLTYSGSQPLRTVYVNAADSKGDETIIAAIKSDLIAWALGNDPLPALLTRLKSETTE